MRVPVLFGAQPSVFRAAHRDDVFHMTKASRRLLTIVGTCRARARRENKVA